MATSMQTICATCVRGTRTFAGRYRAFLLAPGMLVTLGSLLLLIAAISLHPAGLISSGTPAEAGSPLYLLAALVGAVYIWWSALQDIRARDFTADIPVSIATAAAILIHQYSAAAVVAVLLLIGGMLEEFVSARAGKADRAARDSWLGCCLTRSPSGVRAATW